MREEEESLFTKWQSSLREMAVDVQAVLPDAPACPPALLEWAKTRAGVTEDHVSDLWRQLLKDTVQEGVSQVQESKSSS